VLHIKLAHSSGSSRRSSRVAAPALLTGLALLLLILHSGENEGRIHEGRCLGHLHYLRSCNVNFDIKVLRANTGRLGTKRGSTLPCPSSDLTSHSAAMRSQFGEHRTSRSPTGVHAYLAGSVAPAAQDGISLQMISQIQSDLTVGCSSLGSAFQVLQRDVPVSSWRGICHNRVPI
jgi:hypothetical protein